MNFCKTFIFLFVTFLPCYSATCDELKSYNFVIDQQGEIIEKHIQKHSKRLKTQRTISFVDYSKSINEKRFFVFDLNRREIIYSTFVGHSGYSGRTHPLDTSNTPNTKKTSVGLFKVGVQYYGRFGKSKKLHGLSKTNSNAYKRAIVAHSLEGSSVRDLYSWGCFTFFERDLDNVFKYMKKGTYLLAIK